MKFSGELKFPEIDHPGVPVTFLVEGRQAELLVEGESLGRWSLYDVHARRLVASAFQIDLDGTEVTFVADDPVDFAYRGVEHMAETWASIKAKRIANRTIAVRKSRKGTSPSRMEDMKAAMVSNLEAQDTPRQIAGEVAMPDPTTETPTPEVTQAGDWDKRDQAAAIPVVGTEADEENAADPALERDRPLPGDDEPVIDGEVTDLQRQLEEERRQLAEERAKLEEERRIAEQREADRVEAYRLEMQRLEAEREALRRQDEAGSEETSEKAAQPEIGEADAHAEIAPEPEPEVAPRPGVVDLNDLEEPTTDDREPPVVGDHEPAPAPTSDEELPAPVSPPVPPVSPPTQHRQDPEPAMAGAPKGKGGLRGAVRAAFKTGPKDHDHQFIEAPGGIGITRYVCEECGYVSISV